MSAFPDWEKYVVEQREPDTGCIPTGYEVLLRAAGVKGIDYSTFQEDFDLDRSLAPGEEQKNNFGSVAAAVRNVYSDVRFIRREFGLGEGDKKVLAIDEFLAKRHPVLASVVVAASPTGIACHIMPVVDADDSRFLLLTMVDSDGRPRTAWITKEQMAHRHNTYERIGNDIAFLEMPDE